MIRARVRSRALQPAALETSGSPRHSLAVAAAIAVVVGLAPASVDRAHATWTPQAYDRGARRDADFVRIEVYPAPVRRVVERFRPGSTVLASFDETRKIAALAPVQSVEESELRELERAAPATSGEFVAWAGWGGGSDDIRIPRDIDYVVVPAGDASFEGVIDYATECGWLDRSRGGLRIFERRGDRCAPAQVDEPQP